MAPSVTLAPRHAWVPFLSPKDNKLQYWCHTKDYKVQQLLPGQNYMDFFNIPQTVPKVTLPEPDTGQLIEDNAARMQLSEFANSIDTPPLSLPQHDSSAPTVLKLRMMLDTGNSPISICSNALNTLLKKATPSKTKFTGALDKWSSEKAFSDFSGASGIP
jgi:hypothetical protein